LHSLPSNVGFLRHRTYFFSLSCSTDADLPRRCLDRLLPPPAWPLTRSILVISAGFRIPVSFFCSGSELSFLFARAETPMYLLSRLLFSSPLVLWRLAPSCAFPSFPNLSFWRDHLAPALVCAWVRRTPSCFSNPLPLVSNPFGLQAFLQAPFPVIRRLSEHLLRNANRPPSIPVGISVVDQTLFAFCPSPLTCPEGMLVRLPPSPDGLHRLKSCKRSRPYAVGTARFAVY